MQLIRQVAISIHSSHTGRDGFCRLVPSDIGRGFQSTLPIREETCCSVRPIPSSNFNPLFPYGKRPPSVCAWEKGDGFQSTLPIREETRRSGCCRPCQGISIHSSHTRRDTSQYGSYLFRVISIHSSHTGRDVYLLGRKKA